MSLLKVLQFGDNKSEKYNQKFLLLDYKCHFIRDHNEYRPTGVKQCERLELTLVASKSSNTFIYQWFVNQEMKSGRFTIEYPIQGNNTSDETRMVYFEDAMCYSIEEEYHIGDLQTRKLKLCLIADNITIDEITFTRS